MATPIELTFLRDTAPPKRKGFGSRMIERALAAQLSGKVTIDYQPNGVLCTIDAPLAAIRDQAGA